jgi:lipoprotein-anchoring transpeptidase ErfK/SrfK
MVMGGGLVALGGCVSRPPVPVEVGPTYDPSFKRMYAAIDNERFPIPAVDLSEIDPEFLRREVAYDTSQQPGTIVVDPNDRFLYLVRPNGRAMRYGIGVGREGFSWNGNAQVRRKAQWPTWTPPTEMIKRQPELRRYASGMPGGPENPLGARALYLYQGDRDTLYRIHGTNEPWTIGQAVSSGCIRLINQDIIDLYSRVPSGSKVVVLRSNPDLMAQG